MHIPDFRADMGAGSLLVRESRVVAGLLLQEAKPEDFHQALMKDNLLQKKNPVSARRQARLIRNRLESMPRDFWLFVRDGDHDAAAQALLCAAIRQNRLLGDFLLTTVREHIRTYQKTLALRDFDLFFEQCRLIEPAISQWSESTVRKIRQVVFRILAEAKIIASTRSPRLLPFVLLPEIHAALSANQEQYVLQCLEGLQ